MRKQSSNPVVMVSGNIAQTLCDLVGMPWEEKKPFDFDRYQAKMEKRILRARSESTRIMLQDHAKSFDWGSHPMHVTRYKLVDTPDSKE